MYWEVFTFLQECKFSYKTIHLRILKGESKKENERERNLLVHSPAVGWAKLTPGTHSDFLPTWFAGSQTVVASFTVFTGTLIRS